MAKINKHSRFRELMNLADTPRVWDDSNPTNLTNGLIDLCLDWVRPEHVIVEVGSFAGVSTAVFANFAQQVYAVDPGGASVNFGYDEIGEVALRNAHEKLVELSKRLCNIELIENFSVVASKRFENESIDLVYIDAWHKPEAFIADVKAWLPKVKRGGILAGHDYGLVGVYFVGLLPKPHTLYQDSSWVIRREDVKV